MSPLVAGVLEKLAGVMGTKPLLAVVALGLSITAAASDRAVLWQDPADTHARNLYYGPGGAEHQPRGACLFEKEDMHGVNPKFVCRDTQGVKWKVKLGPEAKPETAASRLMWAAGYYSSEDYFVERLNAGDVPRLRRGRHFLAPDGTVLNVRLKRHDGKKIGTWKWRDNPFTGTRELNGLRVMMALLNNWDVTDENNAIYQRDGTEIYLVSDIGSTFGAGRLTWPLGRARSNLECYRHSTFISDATPDYVDFRTPAPPALWFLATPWEFVKKCRLTWIGKHIPRGDARWIGQVLARISPNQIRDAFRAAGYSPREVEGFTAAIEDRIAQLNSL
jgi:hypothetical protein